VVSLVKQRYRSYQQNIPKWVALCGYVLIVLGPFFILGYATVQALLSGEGEWLRLLLPTGRRLVLLRNSIGLAMSVAIAAMCFGWVGATIVWSWSGKKNPSLIWLVLPLAALPSYIYALAWFSIATSINRLLGSGAARLLQGWAGSLWVEIAAFSPLALGFAWIGLRDIDPDLIEAGRLSRSDFQSLIRIALPLSLPATLTGGGIIFLFSILDYGIPSLFQIDVYALEIFAEYSATNSPERAFLLAVPLLLFAVGVIIALLAPLRRLTSRQELRRPAWSAPPHWSGWVASLGWVIGLLLVVQVLLPLGTLVFMGGAPKQFIPNIIQARVEAGYSLKLAAMAGVFSLPIALGVAQTLLQSFRWSKILWFLVLAPVAMPASLVGVSMVYLFSQPAFQRNAYLNMMPVLVNMARFMPLAVLILLAQLRRMDSLLFDAAQVFQPSIWRRSFQIGVPLLAPGLLVAAGIILALSLGELGATLMVVPPGKSTLTMRIYNYLHYGASSTVMGMSLVLVVSVLLVGGGIATVAYLWSRVFSTPQARR
jgi:iron(III) transport system permease protein